MLGLTLSLGTRRTSSVGGATVPGAPTAVVGTRGNGQVSVAFTAPASDGGSAITEYTATSSPGGFTGTGASSPIIVAGLTNGTAYTFTVTATNAVGTGAASSASDPVTPATVPGAPTGAVATPGDTQASVAFTAPASDGGSAISGYTVTSSPGGITATGASSPITVTGLTAGTSYTFTVVATNAVGDGAASTATAAVVPWKAIVANGAIAPFVTFTRSSSALDFNSAGVLTSYGNDVPRIGYHPLTLAIRGLLIESGRMNLLQRSQQFDNAYWAVGGTATVTANTATAPDGTTTADTFASTGAAARVRRSLGVSSGNTIFVVVAKANASNFLRLSAASFGGVSEAWDAFFDLASGTVGTVSGSLGGARVEPAGNDWWRCFIWFNDTTDMSGSFDMFPVDGDGDGNTSVGNSIYIWQADAVSGIPFFTSPIHTVASTASRAADSATISNLADIGFNAGEGTFYFEGTAPSAFADNAFPFDIHDGTTSNNIRLKLLTSGQLQVLVTVGGVGQALLNLGTLTPGQEFKAAVSYAVNDIRGCLDGGTEQTDASASLPTVDRGTIGGRSGGDAWNSWIKHLRYYPSAQSTQAITA